MGLPVSGAWSRKYQLSLPYVDARKWGTGINLIHAYRIDPGRPYAAKLDANDMGFRTPAESAIPQALATEDWGYQPEDIAGLDVFAEPVTAIHGIPYQGDGWPAWTGGVQEGESTPVNRATIAPYAQRPWQQPRRFYERIRSIWAGARDEDREVSNQLPTESVNEGWLNKASTGMGIGQVPDEEVVVSSPAQYERNTSMQQRHKPLENARAVLRGQDDPRSDIPSRIMPMKVKTYSQGERDYDMFPYQIDDMPRAFRYRTAGTGPGSYLLSNDQHDRNALQRTPPADPSMGTPDTELGEDYGFASEDLGYY